MREVKKGWNENGVTTIFISSLNEKNNSFQIELKVNFLECKMQIE